MKKLRTEKTCGKPTDFSKLYARLKPFYEKAKKGKAARGYHFNNCVSASFAKAYEFNVLANKSDQKTKRVFPYCWALKHL